MQMKAVLVYRPGGPEALDYIEVPNSLAEDRGSCQFAPKPLASGEPDVLIRHEVYKWMPPLPVNHRQ